MNLEITQQLKDYVDNGIARRKQQRRLKTTDVKKVRNSYTFTTQFVDSDYEDWYDVTVKVTVNKSGAQIQVGDKSSYCTFSSVESAIIEINNHLSWRKLRGGK